MERTFFLGQFKNIKISDYISDIPEDVAINPEIMTALRRVQYNHIEETFVRYLLEAASMNVDLLSVGQDKLEEVVALVQDNRLTSLENLKEAFAELDLKTVKLNSKMEVE